MEKSEFVTIGAFDFYVTHDIIFMKDFINNKWYIAVVINWIFTSKILYDILYLCKPSQVTLGINYKSSFTKTISRQCKLKGVDPNKSTWSAKPLVIITHLNKAELYISLL